MKPVHVVTRKGTIVDCKPGALVAGAPAVTGSLVIEAVLSLLSQAIPERAIAPYTRLVSPLIVGNNPQTNQLYVYTSFCSAGGAGAVTGYDGYQCVCDIGTLGVVGKTDAEDEMARFPWDINQYEFRTDSHGAGKWRGSPGIVWEGVNEGGKCNFIGGPWSGFSTQAEGQQGGGATPLNRAYILRDGKKIDITQPHLPLEMKPLDRLVTLSGGGAGIGKPETRDVESVRMDVLNELVSLEMARNAYKVAINPETFEIDREETRKLRKER
jgi:N-methylhydantoinase B